MKTFRINRAPIVGAHHTHSRRALIGISAATFLLLCLWLGPRLACSLLVVIAIVAVWVALCRRYPAAGYLTGIFFVGFVGGLFGLRRR